MGTRECKNGVISDEPVASGWRVLPSVSLASSAKDICRSAAIANYIGILFCNTSADIVSAQLRLQIQQIALRRIQMNFARNQRYTQ